MHVNYLPRVAAGQYGGRESNLLPQLICNSPALIFNLQCRHRGLFSHKMHHKLTLIRLRVTSTSN